MQQGVLGLPEHGLHASPPGPPPDKSLVGPGAPVPGCLSREPLKALLLLTFDTATCMTCAESFQS